MGETAMTGDDTPDRWGEKLGADVSQSYQNPRRAEFFALLPVVGLAKPVAHSPMRCPPLTT